MLVQSFSRVRLVRANVTLVLLLFEVDCDDVLLEVGLLPKGRATNVADKGPLLEMHGAEVLVQVVFGLGLVLATGAGERLLLLLLIDQHWSAVGIEATSALKR